MMELEYILSTLKAKAASVENLQSTACLKDRKWRETGIDLPGHVPYFHLQESRNHDSHPQK